MPLLESQKPKEPYCVTLTLSLLFINLQLSSEVSGRGAKTKVRGRLKNEAEEEKLKKERAEMVRKDMEAKYARWNKG